MKIDEKHWWWFIPTAIVGTFGAVLILAPVIAYYLDKWWSRWIPGR